MAWVESWLGLRIRAAPKAWDYVWGKDERFFAVVTFTDGSRIGVGWAGDSWASGFPNEEDVYFEVVYSLTDDGKLGELVPRSAGVLLKRADIRSIELIGFDASEESIDKQQQAGDNDTAAGATTPGSQ